MADHVRSSGVPHEIVPNEIVRHARANTSIEEARTLGIAAGMRTESVLARVEKPFRDAPVDVRPLTRHLVIAEEILLAAWSIRPPSR